MRKQPGILRRILVRSKHGGYADLVFFESKEAAERVVEADSTSRDCLALFQIMQPPDPAQPDQGVLSLEPIPTNRARRAGP